MNLKEAFRYQNFLERTMRNATMAAKRSDVTTTTTKVHARRKAHAEAADETETVESEVAYDANHIFALMAKLIQAREDLSQAIFQAKVKAASETVTGIDIDAMSETNKFRQLAATAMRDAMNIAKPGKHVEKGTAYCFNAEGNQTSYTYDVEVTTEVLFDRKAVQSDIQKILQEADTCSTIIEKTHVDTEVDFKPPWPVNATFDEVMECIVDDAD